MVLLVGRDLDRMDSFAVQVHRLWVLLGQAHWGVGGLSGPTCRQRFLGLDAETDDSPKGVGYHPEGKDEPIRIGYRGYSGAFVAVDHQEG